MNNYKKSSSKSHGSDSIESTKDIEKVRSVILDNPRDLLLFDFAVHTGIGMKKLLQLKAKHLMGAGRGEAVSIQTDTGDRFSLTLIAEAYDSFQSYLKNVAPGPDDYLFTAQGKQHPLKLSSVSNMIKGWFEAAHLKGNFGAISLRKTWELHCNTNRGERNDTGLNDLFSPIQTSSVQKQIYNKLLSAIVSGKISPGTRITTTEISKSFGVSHAPVRVAMNWLEAKGFIEAQKKTGSLVRELGIEELHEIIKVRIILETAAAKLSCKVRTEETLERLAAIIQQYKKAGSFEESDILNRKFHETMYRDAGMPLLVRIILDLYDRFSPYAAMSYSLTGNIPDYNNANPHSAVYYHIKILDAMRNKNLPEVLKYLKRKLGRAKLITERLLKERETRVPG